jgi:hypothetical protein
MDKKHIEKGILLVPLFLAFIWMGYVVLDFQSPDPNMKLAPTRLDNLVNALFIFIVGYSIFLVFFFIHLNKDVKKEDKKIEKKIVKKSKARKKKKKK